MRWALVVAIVAALAWPGVAGAATAWEEWQHVPGVVDVGGVRSDGKLVVMANGQMLLVGPDGAMTPFARGSDGFAGSADAEPYFVVASVTPGACTWEADDAFVLDLSSPPGLIRVDPSGHASKFATFAGMDTLNGIAFDNVGSFGYRVIVTGSAQNQEAVFAVDCQGAVSTITASAPTMEGGFAVAPSTSGTFAGELIGADENSGQIWAVAPDGTSSLVLMSGLLSGGDTGVESIGIVPPSFGSAYLADRATANNPFPGTDSLLRLTSATLSAAGVQSGDLLVATEGGGTTLDVRCTPSGCTATTLADGPGDGHTGHIEGHITVTSSS
jgi:hypothetical protein